MIYRLAFLRYFIFMVFIFNLSSVASESKLELGLGVGTLIYPNYLGSKSYSTVAMPMPYLKYSNSYFSIDKDGMNSNLLNIKDLKLDFSVSGSLPANSEKNIVREGMPELNFTFELGPKIIYRFYEKKDFNIDFEFAVRKVFETNLKMLHTQGVVSTTMMKFELLHAGYDITFRSGLRFGDKTFHNYFYGVDKRYQTDTRASYDAPGGYSGYSNKMSFSHRYKKWWYGGLISHHHLNGAAYSSSPLLEVKNSFYFGFSFAYILYQSTN